MRRVKVLRIVAVLLLVAGMLPGLACAAGWKDLLNQVEQKAPSSLSQGSALPDSEIASGLKEALANGVTHAINTLGHAGGFSNNPAVRIPLPGSLQDIAKLATKLGQGDKVDAFKLSLNQAAEKAVPQVANIFGDAIRKMTLKDAKGILDGGDHAATDYFQRVAGPALTKRIEPIVSKATDSVGVTHKYKELVSGTSGGSLGGLMSALGKHSDSGTLNLDDYVTKEAIDGLFTEIGAQEAAIREHPAARTTDLLKKVFGGN